MVLELLYSRASAMPLPLIKGDKLEGSSRIIAASLNMKKVMYCYIKNIC
jgi:hypothetical protein